MVRLGSVFGRSGASIVTSGSLVSIDNPHLLGCVGIGRAAAGRTRVAIRLDGVEDLGVAGAATEVPRQRTADLLAVGAGMPLQVPVRGQDHARRAEAALRARVLEEALLERVELVRGREAADGGDRGAVG